MRLKTFGPPVILDDEVLFTFTGESRRVGVAFLHEDFKVVHSFKRLFLPIDNVETFDPDSKKSRVMYKDANILYLAYAIPEEAGSLSYRLIVDGLWTPDPLNSSSTYDHKTGITLSRLSLPHRERKDAARVNTDGTVTFSFAFTPDEHVTLAGSFNHWDPFMYEMTEDEGVYRLTLGLPPGTYQYAFCANGRRYRDTKNPNAVYLIDESTASEIVVKG
jgi:hypothetical protein